MSSNRSGVAWAGTVVTVLAISACSGTASAPSSTKPSQSSTPSNSASSAAVGEDVAGTGMGAATTPAEAALQLEALLGEHSILASDMMRARIRGDSDLAQAANSALGRNTASMGALLQPVVGQAGVKTFSTVWAQHIQELFAYSRGLATHDEAVRKDALHELVEYEEDLAGYFASASHGRLSGTAALDAVRMHVTHLVEGANAYAAKKYSASANLYRVSYAHTYDLGSTLAQALLPASAPALAKPAVRLRSTLTKLLGEHVALVIAAMRSSVGDRADFTAMGDAVNGNTLDLTAAFDTLFGAKAAKGFQSHWGDHVDQLLAYTQATVKHDAAAQEQARTTLRGFETSFASFLNTATENRLGQPALAQTFVMHDRMLLAEIDAYASGNYQQAHDLSDQTYDEMFTVSGKLAGAIGATLAGKLPSGGSQTGGGGMAAALAGR